MKVGRITALDNKPPEQRDWHIHCAEKGCVEWVNITTRSGLLAATMKRHGWKYAGKGEWICPECSAIA